MRMEGVRMLVLTASIAANKLHLIRIGTANENSESAFSQAREIVERSGMRGTVLGVYTGDPPHGGVPFSKRWFNFIQDDFGHRDTRLSPKSSLTQNIARLRQGAHQAHPA